MVNKKNYATVITNTYNFFNIERFHSVTDMLHDLGLRSLEQHCFVLVIISSSAGTVSVSVCLSACLSVEYAYTHHKFNTT